MHLQRRMEFDSQIYMASDYAKHARDDPSSFVSYTPALIGGLLFAVLGIFIGIYHFKNQQKKQLAISIANAKGELTTALPRDTLKKSQPEFIIKNSGTTSPFPSADISPDGITAFESFEFKIPNPAITTK